MHIGIVTLFPQMFEAITAYGISGRAVKTGLVELQYWNPRDFAVDKHHTVDDRPYGGGPGMLMQPGPLNRAIIKAKECAGPGDKSKLLDKGCKAKKEGTKVVYLSPQGEPLNQQGVARLAEEESLVLLCGRYEGVDERVIDSLVDEECSLGDFVLSGGELAAMALIDAMIRLQPGALGHADSAVEDSFVNGLLDYPHYTRPSEFEGQWVPKVLLSGDHGEIARWRMQQSLGRTWLRRPDLLAKISLTDEQQSLLDDFIIEHNELK